jgi:NAD(P)H dehydrogenase (quinone)
MTIVVTGATGHFGRVAVQSLLARGVPAADIVATGRSVEKIADLGVTSRRAAYEDPAALRTAFEGADKLLFVSGSEVGKRIPQHRDVVTAAQDAGVGFVAYTSIPKADTTSIKLAEEHLATERMLIESGLPYAFLRNGWYLENYDLAGAIEHGLFGAAGNGRISAAPRADYAEAAAEAIVRAEPNRVYELGGEPFTLAELAATISRESGRPVTYTDLTQEKYAEFLIGVGLPEQAAAILADADRGAAQGELDVPGDDLATLLGRPVTALASAVRAQLALA